MIYYKIVNGDWVQCSKTDLSTGDRFKRIEKSGHTLESVFSNEALLINESISRREFWQRVGDYNYAKLLNIAETDNVMKARIDIINADQNVWLQSPEYTQWFADLVSTEVITQDEYNVIFEVKYV